MRGPPYHVLERGQGRRARNARGSSCRQCQKRVPDQQRSMRKGKLSWRKLVSRDCGACAWPPTRPPSGRRRCWKPRSLGVAMPPPPPQHLVPQWPEQEGRRTRQPLVPPATLLSANALSAWPPPRFSAWKMQQRNTRIKARTGCWRGSRVGQGWPLSLRSAKCSAPLVRLQLRVLSPQLRVCPHQANPWPRHPGTRAVVTLQEGWLCSCAQKVR